MLIAARLIGILIVIMGCAITLNPGVFKAVLNFWKQGKNIYLAGAIRLAVGIILLLAAPQCKLSAVITTLGVLTIIGAILLFALGPVKMQAIFAWWDKRPGPILRLMGVVALIFGSLILYSV